jgi:hypothetical protein
LPPVPKNGLPESAPWHRLPVLSFCRDCRGGGATGSARLGLGDCSVRFGSRGCGGRVACCRGRGAATGVHRVMTQAECGEPDMHGMGISMHCCRDDADEKRGSTMRNKSPAAIVRLIIDSLRPNGNFACQPSRVNRSRRDYTRHLHLAKCAPTIILQRSNSGEQMSHSGSFFDRFNVALRCPIIPGADIGTAVPRCARETRP